MFSDARGSFYFNKISIFLAVVFSVNSLVPGPALAQVLQRGLSVSSAIALPGNGFIPVGIKALKIRQQEPLVFDFVIDNGTTGLKGEELKTETRKLAKYFLAAVTIPEKDLWVNLSPYENNRIISNELGVTEMGRDMLAQDSVLKQLSASVINPDSATGKAFWSKVYAKASGVLGTTDIPLEALQKIWIVPGKAQVYEMGNTAVVGESSLKVMLDRDYEAQGHQEKTIDDADSADAVKARDLSLELMRDVVLPAVEKEVNEGKDFAPLRQVYGAMILATWYKQALKESLLVRVYADQKKTAGVETSDKTARERIYQEYLAAFNKGAFNFIHEDADPVSGELIPRKYFSGGEEFTGLPAAVADQRLRVSGLTDVPAVVRGLSNRDASETVATVALVAADTALGINAGLTGTFEAANDQYEKWLTTNATARLSGGEQAARKLHYDGKNSLGGMIPTAVLTEEQLRDGHFYKVSLNLPAEPQENTVIYMPLLGGVATSMGMTDSFYEYVGGVIGRKIEKGTKGTDVFFKMTENGKETFVNPLEMNLLRLMDDLKNRRVGKVVFQPMLNEDSVKAVNALFNDTIFAPDRVSADPSAPRRTWREVLNHTKGFEFGAPLMQGMIKVYSLKDRDYTNRFRAPGGHGFLGHTILMAMATGALREGAVVTSNGDGANNMPVSVAAQMENMGSPIVLMTNIKKPKLDLKVGLLGVEGGAPGSREIAAVKEMTGAGAMRFFEEVGTRSGDLPQVFLNNNILFNTRVLAPIMRDLYELVGPEKLNEKLFEGVILNKKKKIDGHSEEDVFQVELAISTMLLNLNRYWITNSGKNIADLRKKYHRDHLIDFINLEKKGADGKSEDYRHWGFTPVKNPFDVVILSGLFRPDINTGMLQPKKPQFEYPEPAFIGKYYETMAHTVQAFPPDIDMTSLKAIYLDGQVLFSAKTIFRGTVMVESKEPGEVNLNTFVSQLQFENGAPVLGEEGKIRLYTIDQGKLTIKDLTDVQQAAPAFKLDVKKDAAENVSEEVDEVREGASGNTAERQSAVHKVVQGGIDFNASMLDLVVERVGNGVKVTIDPGVMERIQARGVVGFSPVIVNMVPVTGLGQALGLAANP